MQTFMCQKWGKWKFGSKPTNPPTSTTSNSIVQLPRPGGVGNREALKAPRSKLGNPPKEPRPPPPEPASAMLAACGDSPKDGDVVVSFFFWGGGLTLNWRQECFGFFGWGSFRFSVFSFWCGESRSLSRLFWLVLKNSWMKPIELKFKNKRYQNWRKNCPTKRALCAPNLSRDLPPTREQRRQGLVGPPQTRWVPGQNGIQKSHSKQMWVSCGLWRLCLPTWTKNNFSCNKNLPYKSYRNMPCLWGSGMTLPFVRTFPHGKKSANQLGWFRACNDVAFHEIYT